jgi:hypothetical protein
MRLSTFCGLHRDMEQVVLVIGRQVVQQFHHAITGRFLPLSVESGRCDTSHFPEHLELNTLSLKTRRSTTDSTNKKQEKGGKQILMVPSGKGRYWRAESAN